MMALCLFQWTLFYMPWHTLSSLCSLFPEQPSSVWTNLHAIAKRPKKKKKQATPCVCVSERGVGDKYKGRQKHRKLMAHLVLFMNMWLLLFSFYFSFTFLKSDSMIIDRHCLSILVNTICVKTCLQGAWLSYPQCYQEVKEDPILRPRSVTSILGSGKVDFELGVRAKLGKKLLSLGIQAYSVPWRFLYLDRLQVIEVDDTGAIWKLHGVFSLVLFSNNNNKKSDAI